MGATLLAWPGAIAIGITVGLFGSGGSVLTVPVLLYLFDQDEKVAIAESLAIVGAIAAAGALPYLRSRHVDWRNVAAFGLPGMAGTCLGAWIAGFVSGTFQLALFAAVMLLAAGLMLYPPKLEPGQTAGKKRVTSKIAFDGLLVGTLTGLVGVGGGFLIVPALVLLGGLPMQRAIGTSLVIIALKSLSGFAQYLGVLDAQGLSLNWEIIAAVAALGVAGSLAGGSLADWIPREKLPRYFSVFLAVMATFLLVNSAPAAFR